MSSSNQRILVSLRRMILDGDLKPAERLAEIPVAEQLGVSRTPVRLAFRTLEQEGLLEKAGNRGYVVRRVSTDDVRNAIEVRGALEGLAARRLAEQGLPAGPRRILTDCLDEADSLFSKGYFRDEDIGAYHDLNVRFHTTVVEACGNEFIRQALSKVAHPPLASLGSMFFETKELEKEYLRLYFAHMQHCILVSAIKAGEGARAEAIMREHSNAATTYPEIFLRAKSADGLRAAVNRFLENLPPP